MKERHEPTMVGIILVWHRFLLSAEKGFNIKYILVEDIPAIVKRKGTIKRWRIPNFQEFHALKSDAPYSILNYITPVTMNA
jgi:hypothetical protein